MYGLRWCCSLVRFRRQAQRFKPTCRSDDTIAAMMMGLGWCYSLLCSYYSIGETEAKLGQHLTVSLFFDEDMVMQGAVNS